ncbi:MAG TPA: DUF2911 domain-containing protein [Longimicrobiales bacterium]
MRAVRLSRGLGFGLVVLTSALLPACAQQGDAGSEEAAAAAEGSAAQTAAAGAAAMDAPGGPACAWTDSGAELTGRASPPDSASVRLGDGVAKVCYSAPSARGRQIMGGLVPYGQPWRLGANEATTIHVTVPAEIGTVRVEPGSYSLYAIPGESEWTIVVNREANRWGIPINENVRAQDVGSFTVTPTQTDHVERLSIQFEPAEEGAAQMVIAWETTRLAFPVRPAGG